MAIEDIVLIKINKTYRENMSPEELYHATSISWVASFEKTKRRDLQFYCSIYQNKIIEVYKFLGSKEEIPKRSPARFILHGELAAEEIRQKLIGIDVSTVHKGSGNPIKYVNYETLLQLHDSVQVTTLEEELELIELGEIHATNLIPHIEKYIKSKGFNYSLENIKNLYLSLRSKPFVIISGISGTGKTKIAQLFAESIGANETNGQFTLIPVRPDWSDGSELLGYKDLSGTFMEGPLTKVVREASENVDRPYFILLDEMNLARVEYYFSDMLSIMESRKKVGNGYTSALLLPDVDRQLTLPENVYIIGTVNMDETTHPFSKKVLDRANTIEFNEIDLMSFAFLETAEQVEPVYVANGSLEASYVQLQDCFVGNEFLVKKVSHELSAINQIIEPLHAHVGYRVRDEICFYMIHNSEGALLSEEKALDYCIMQKILPRLAGSGMKIHTVLEKLFAYFTGSVYDAGADFDEQTARYPQSAKKVNDMLGRLEEDDFTSFWIS